MAGEYWTEFSDYAAPYGSDHLSSEERRLQTLRNLAMSKVAKARRKKKKRTESAERKITDAERREQEQARIRAERQARGALSEENRRLASGGTAQPFAELPAEAPLLPEEYPADLQQPEPVLLPEPEIDIALPEEPAPAEQLLPAEPVKKKQRTKQNTSSRAASASRFGRAAAASPNRITTGGAVTLGILTGVLIGTVIYGRVQTNEVYTKIAALQTEYNDLVARNISMKSEMEGKLTVKNIEEYAEDVLGLMPLNQSQIEYIQLQTEDEVVITEPEDNLFVTINDYLVGIWEFLRGK